MTSYKSFEPQSRTVRDIFFLLAIAVALGLGLAMASPAQGAGLGSSANQISSAGSISGTVTVTGGNAAGITVELRQRTNGGTDKVLATATTDETGNYSFAGQGSAPNDAFYYVKFTGGQGTLADWYSFPIIYLSGSNFTVPSVEMADVQIQPLDPVVSLPTPLQWKARRSGETYRIFVYSKGDTSKTVLDSGSLGMGTAFTLPQGSLPDGSYQAVVQVRDAIVGYGQSRTQFHFTVGKAPNTAPGLSQGAGQQPGSGDSVQPGSPSSADGQSPTSVAVEPTAVTVPSTPTTAPQAPAQTQPQSPGGSPNLQLSLSADHPQVQQGDTMIYKIEVSNQGSTVATGVVVTDNLPSDVTVDSSTARSTSGSLAVQGNNVTVQLGDLPANSRAIIEIPVSVNKGAGSNVSNQASAQYQDAPAPVSSNAFIAQVDSPQTGSPASPPQTLPQQPPASQPQSPSQSQPQAPSQSQPQAPASNPQGSQPAEPPASQPKAPPAIPPRSQPQTPAKKPVSSIPQTGGSFPLVLALLILLVILLARYLRGRSYRRT
jgi:uncharacterized repeat protein (TIGR01451 family)